MELSTRAYAAFEVKDVSDSRRTFRGWATTPALDRVGDTINPMGVKFKNPLALLHQHRHDMPIGTVNFGTPTKKGIPFEAEIPEISEPATLKERLDVAWGEIKHGLVRAVSIGFKPIKYAFTDAGVDYQEVEVYELSSVTIPALPEAVITAVKSMAPLSRDLITAIKSADADVLRERGIKLISARDVHLKRGAISLR
jgi:HK97 family phage prohead protease